MTSERQQRRSAQILEAALQVFAAEGYHDASIADVARAAGVSEKTVYDYFPSKEELLFAIPIAPTIEAVEALDLALPYVRGAGNKIRAIIYHFVSFYQRHPDFARVSLLFVRRNPNFLETETFNRLRVTYRVVDSVVEEGIAAGEFREGTDPQLVRWAVIGSIDYIVLRWLQQGEPENPTGYVDPLADLIVNGIRRDASAADITLRLAVEPGVTAGSTITVTGGTETETPALARRPRGRLAELEEISRNTEE